ncbi:hypothetical protein ASPZODRAFT_68404 [Penicilliopsis zonata CBS 506.65]|uniref:Sulfotransferase domain-containing protein n=1 Tax=Penicilliopsis zonata CBS 506.65 TaxID=1073090 RepID=A0A1L9SEF6_9EURO|nr:hypothetical protein ASPZODRAFT_68404 [Penicilliopsis zonata CBS 506.65]OJJ45571.1 hypothetical protein ASPZODRAFT_68404 [Penicilliopsis zonata CBS 506.65]
MSNRPIFVATHPRACSTAFERVFMTRRDTIQCVHEPFGDAFYYGPERLSARFAGDDHEEERLESGFSNSTFKTVMDRIEREASEGKRVFIKDINHYLLPPYGKPASIAPSLQKIKRGVGTTSEGVNGHAVGNASSSNGTQVNGMNGVNGLHGMNGVKVNGVHKHCEPYPYDTESEPSNPTIMPYALLAQFHFAFLIRDPHFSVPSYYRCTIPPLDDVTGFYEYYPSEAGYDEVRRTFDYLRSVHLIGPRVATRDDLIVGVDNASRLQNGHGDNSNCNGATTGVEICVIDADDLLDNPVAMIKAFCRSVGLEYDPGMLNWDNEADHEYAKAAFEKWKGFHNDAIESKYLAQREHRHIKTEEEFDAEWRKKYGDKGAALIRKTVDENMADYLYLKQFAMRV